MRSDFSFKRLQGAEKCRRKPFAAEIIAILYTSNTVTPGDENDKVAGI